ncbi:hypothetical protein B296_00010326 [Ensete ventricosum]|uniref:C2 domain-containing protein n=1 Tax=Ensete ventricosum TaxID=4639 RepID=A0A427A7L3_ENSVE|nr:hypothetical protein B296_00010326 [Ensete ventricosum]
MGFFNSVFGFFGFGIGIAVGLVIGYYLFIYFQPTDVKCKEPLFLETKLALILFLKIDWLNKFLEYMWPYLDKAICKTAKEIAKPIIAENTAKFKIDSVEFETLTLGTLPPTFQGYSLSKHLGRAFYRALKKPTGILNVNVVRAYKLKKKDLLGKSDPYVKLKLSDDNLPSKKTTVKRSNLNPEWNEEFKLVVKEPESQALEFSVYDWEQVGKHDKMGVNTVPLKDLTPDETKSLTLDLLKNLDPNDPQNDKSRGQIVLEVTYRPFKEGEVANDISDDEGDTQKPPEGTPAGGGLLVVIVHEAQDLEGKHHTNPYVRILFRGDEKKTKVP